ncbi:MAG: TonB-dependent receptor, partial [Bacteroidota bacterium]
EVGLDVNDPPLSTSDFELAHRILGQIAYRFQYGGRFGTTLSLLYEGQSGTPFSWTYSRGDDVNGDGFDRADLIYVPADASEVVVVDGDGNPDAAGAAAFQAFIDGNDDLSDARGSIIERNSGRAPWNDFLDARISQQITTLNGQNIELSLDIQNVLSLLGVGGEVTFVDDQRFELVDFQGYDTQGRQIISFDPTDDDDVYEVSDFASRWRMQLGLRYTF